MIKFSVAWIESEEVNIPTIQFDYEELPRLITVFERALNTLSPMDHELLKVLEDMKEAK